MKLPDHIPARTINLGFNVGFALAVPWLQWPRSVLGDFSSYASPPDGFQTELAALSKFDKATAGTVAAVCVPLVGRFVEKENSGPMGPYGNPANQRPEERWLFINGICTDHRLAIVNAEMLAGVFGRPITILYNATDSLLPDLLECFVGKAFNSVTEAVAKNLMPLVEALIDPGVERVVLVSHSQGTIIASIMLKWLEEVLASDQRGQRVKDGAGAQKESPERRAARRLTDQAGKKDPNYGHAAAAHALAKEQLRADQFGKLEVYCFANCSTAMNPIAAVGAPVHHAPWIESYGNEYDLVARLGVLAPPHGIGSARIEGDRYRREGAWGHLLNAHYLIPILPALKMGSPADVGLTPFDENLLKVPRLWGYYNGAKPPLPYP